MNTAELAEAEVTEEIRTRTKRLMERPLPSYEAPLEEWSMDGQIPNAWDEFGSMFREQSKQLRVLLVEYADTADYIDLLLRLWGHNTQVCHNGSEVLEAAAAYHPHVVLLDIGLPGMDAFQLARRLREQPDLKKAVLISITGFGDKTHRREAKEEGFADNLIKAVAPQQLEALLLKIAGDQVFPVPTKRQELELVCTPKEHVAVLENPDQFDSFHRRNDFLAEGIHTVFGVKDGNAQPLAFCFPADHFTPAAAREWLQERGLEPLVFTEATESEETSTVERSEVPLSAS
jgi:CheY-like chemotaxis protein